MKTIIVSINSKYIHSSLAAWYLKSAAADIENCEIEILEWTINRKKSELIEKIFSIAPDAIAFCTYIWNVEYILDTLSEIKKISLTTRIILGGPQVSFDASRYIARDDVDYVIGGEGEIPFAKLMQSLTARESNICIEGVYRDGFDGGIYFGKSTPPEPYTGEYLERLCGRITYIETTRGCPFRCSFCLSGREERVKLYPMERVKRDILTLANSGTQTVKFVDRSFNVYPQRAFEIITYIKERVGSEIPLGVQFHFEIAGDVLTEELIAAFVDAPKGLFRLEIGLQSFNSKTLEEINRKTDIERLKRNIMLLTKGDGLHVHIDLIAGLPQEDYDSFKESFNTAYSLSPDVLQMGFLKLLPGSPMAESPQGDFSESAPYEVIRTPWLTEPQLSRLHDVEHVLEKLSNSHKFDETLNLALKHYPTPFDLFEEVAQHVGAPHGEELFCFAARLFDHLEKNIDRSRLLQAMTIDMKNLNPVGRTPRFIRERTQTD